MKKHDYKISSDNLYADFGYKNPEEMQAKADLAKQLYLIIQSKKMTQREVAALLGLTQPKVSNLLNGRLSGYSIERLTRFLNILDYDVNIVVKPKPKNRSAQTSISYVPNYPIAAKGYY
jgi:predicted XRE-type DNA-binding protein